MNAKYYSLKCISNLWKFQESAFENTDETQENTSETEVVRSEETPYIVQEKDVLDKIRVVDEVKRKFSGQF